MTTFDDVQDALLQLPWGHNERTATNALLRRYRDELYELVAAIPHQSPDEAIETQAKILSMLGPMARNPE